MHIYNKNTLFYWVKCTSLFIAIEERDSERTERIGANRSIQNKQQRGFLFGRNAKNPLKHWGFLKSKRTTSRWLSLFALQKWRRGRDSNPLKLDWGGEYYILGGFRKISLSVFIRKF